MARITVEDCVSQIPNRFELVVLAARRGKDISSGAAVTVEKDNDKNAVIALREIAKGNISPDTLRDSLKQNVRYSSKTLFNSSLQEDDNIDNEDLENTLTDEVEEEIVSLGVEEDIDDSMFAEDDLDVED